MPKVSLDNYRKQLFEINPYLEVLEDKYINHRRNVLVKCLRCGDVRWKDAPNLLRGHDCNICANILRHEKQKKNKESFEQELANIQPNLQLLSDYYNAYTYVRVRCNICGNEYNALPSNLLHGYGCRQCYLAGHSRTKEEFQTEVNKYTNTITVGDDFVNGKTLCTFKCSVCGSERQYIPNLFLSKGCQCPKCNGTLMMTSEEYKQYIKVQNPYLEVLDDYTGIKNSNTYHCLNCGHVWDDIGDTIKARDYRCPNCQKVKSSAEKKISEFLSNHSIEYVNEKKYDDLLGVNGGKLSYDFYLPNDNILIEAQGEQHERSVELFGGDKKLLIQKEHDKRKSDYAKSHNIRLVEIWYWDFDNIDTILSQELKVS